MALKLIQVLLILSIFLIEDFSNGSLLPTVSTEPWVVSLDQEFEDIQGVPFAITLDQMGYICLGGHFYSKETGANEDKEGIFVTRFDSSGQYIWYTCWESGWNCNITDITTDNAGNIFITGYDEYSSLEISGYRSMRTSPAWGTQNVFLIKVDNDGHGNLVDAWEGYHQPESYIRSINKLCCDSNNNIYVMYGEKNLRKYNSMGQLQWDINTGCYGIDLAIDESGYVYLAGTVFGSDLENSDLDYKLESENSPTVLLLKLNPDHQIIWTKQWISNWVDPLPSICISENTIYLADVKSQPIDIDNGATAEEQARNSRLIRYISEIDLDGASIDTTDLDKPTLYFKVSLDTDTCGNVYMMDCYPDAASSTINGEQAVDILSIDVLEPDGLGNNLHSVTWKSPSQYYSYTYDIACQDCGLVYIVCNVDSYLYLENGELKSDTSGESTNNGYLIKLNISP
jgi:hypothetical protein